MKIYIDGEEGLISFKEGIELSTGLQQIEELLAASRKVITEANLDGQVFTAEDLQDAIEQNASLNSVKELRLTTTGLESYILELLDAQAKGVDELSDTLVEISDGMLDNKNHKSLDMLSGVCDQLGGFLASMMQLRKIFGIDANVQVQGMNIDDAFAEIESLISSMVTALNDGNKSHLADLLEFELSEKIITFKDLLRAMRSAVSQSLNNA